MNPSKKGKAFTALQDLDKRVHAAMAKGFLFGSQLMETEKLRRHKYKSEFKLHPR